MMFTAMLTAYLTSEYSGLKIVRHLMPLNQVQISAGCCDEVRQETFKIRRIQNDIDLCNFKCKVRQTDRQTGRQMDRPTDRLTDKQTRRADTRIEIDGVMFLFKIE